MTFGRWYVSANELAALQVEWMHLLLQATWANFRLKVKDPDKVKIPDPLHLPRPGEAFEQAAPEKSRMTLDSVRMALLGG